MCLVYKQKGFTLIELLVVIAIIALLMAILMPALAKARRMTRAVMCVAQEKQWGAFFMMYTDDFEGSFMGGSFAPGGGSATNWYEVLEPYYKDRSILLCPMANNIHKLTHQGYGNFGCWGGSWFQDDEGDYYYGSYGINEWICNPQTKTGETIYKAQKYWRNTNVKGVSAIPVLADAWWPQAWAEAFDWIPTYPGEWEPVGGDDMAHFVVMRHDGIVNMLFMDWTVKKVHLRDLWPQRWNRQTDQEDCPTYLDYPPWLQKL